jgi:hypothetical protein
MYQNFQVETTRTFGFNTEPQLILHLLETSLIFRIPYNTKKSERGLYTGFYGSQGYEKDYSTLSLEFGSNASPQILFPLIIKDRPEHSLVGCFLEL